MKKSLCTSNNKVETCKYANIDNNSLVDPNTCITSYSTVTGFYNYYYQCNSSNTDYFNKLEYYGNSGNCNGNPNVIQYKAKDGYNFNCSDSRQDCIGLLKIQKSCEEADYNVTQYIVGTCLDIDNNPTKYTCYGGSNTYTGAVKTIKYQSDDTICNDAKNATNSTIKNGCKNNGKLYFVEKCQMPK